MSPRTTERIRAELERQDLYYADKQLLAAGKLREVVVNLRDRQILWPGWTLSLRLMMLADVAYIVMWLLLDLADPIPRPLMIAMNLIILGVHFASAWHSHLEKRKFDRWLRELDELEDSPSALS